MKIKKLIMERDRDRKCIRVCYEGEDFAEGFGKLETKGRLYDVYNLPGGFVLCDEISGRPLRVLESSSAVVDWLQGKYPKALIDTR